MAKVKNTVNNLEKEYRKLKEDAKLFLIIGGSLMGTGILSISLVLVTFGLSLLLTFPLWVTGMGCVIFGVIKLNKSSIYKSGLAGEATSEGALSNLPDEYYIFPSIEIEYEQRKSQIDHLVIGPTGVFIVESKNVNGYIVGTDDDNDITVHKVGQNGGQYENKMYNPTKQVGTHVYRTAGYLKEQGINTWVQGMVYFTNPATTVRLESNKIPVFSEREDGGKEMCSYILNYENKNPLDDEMINKVVYAIEKNLEQGNSSHYNSSPNTSSVNVFDYIHEQGRQFTTQQQTFHQQQMDQQAIQQHQQMNQQIIEQHHQQMNQHAIQHAMDESIKSATPFDFGGYVQGAGLNPSDTAAHDNTMNNMF